MSWRFDRRHGQVLDDAGGVVADVLPEHGDLVAAAPALLDACEAALLSMKDSAEGFSDSELHEAKAVTYARLRDAIRQARSE